MSAPPDANLGQHDLQDEYVKCLFCSTQYRMFGFTRNNERPTMTNPIAWAPVGMGWKLAKCYQHKLIREHLAKVHRRHVDGWGDQDMKAFYWRTCKAFEAVQRKATPESRRAYNVNGQLSRKLRENSVSEYCCKCTDCCGTKTKSVYLQSSHTTTVVVV